MFKNSNILGLSHKIAFVNSKIVWEVTIKPSEKKSEIINPMYSFLNKLHSNYLFPNDFGFFRWP